MTQMVVNQLRKLADAIERGEVQPPPETGVAFCVVGTHCQLYPLGNLREKHLATVNRHAGALHLGLVIAASRTGPINWDTVMEAYQGQIDLVDMNMLKWQEQHEQREREYPFQCRKPGCNWRYKTERGRDRHEQKVHGQTF